MLLCQQVLCGGMQLLRQRCMMQPRQMHPAAHTRCSTVLHPKTYHICPKPNLTSQGQTVQSAAALTPSRRQVLLCRSSSRAIGLLQRQMCYRARCCFASPAAAQALYACRCASAVCMQLLLCAAVPSAALRVQQLRQHCMHTPARYACGCAILQPRCRGVHAASHALQSQCQRPVLNAAQQARSQGRLLYLLLWTERTPETPRCNADVSNRFVSRVSQ